jgi:hypothetical protein
VRSRRLLFVLLVAALVVGALAAGRATTATGSTTATSTVAPNAAVAAQSSPVWFCPGLPPALPHASARVALSNIGSNAADVVVTDLLDNGTSTHVSLTIAADTVVVKPRDQLGGPGALTVETFGGRVLVEEGIDSSGAMESTPCATQASPHWYFAAGSTPRGVQQWLVIDNPYASDAKVDVTLRTGGGVLRPDALQGLDVARRSRVVVAVHDVAVRQDRVAVAVVAEVGAVIAAQTLVYSNAAGTPGVALSMGAPTIATEWTFAGATAEPGSVAYVAIVNVGSDDAQVDVQASAESSKQVLAPASVTVAQDAVVWVALGQCSTAAGKGCVSIPDGARYSLDVRSEQNVSIVAQTLGRLDATGTVVGTVTSPGGIAPARSWAFARSRVTREKTTTLSLFNPTAAPATVGVGLVRGGAVERPAALQNVSVPPGRVVTVVVVGGPKPAATADAALTIDSSQPIFVERLIVATAEASTSVGVVVG